MEFKKKWENDVLQKSNCNQSNIFRTKILNKLFCLWTLYLTIRFFSLFNNVNVYLICPFISIYFVRKILKFRMYVSINVNLNLLNFVFYSKWASLKITVTTQQKFCDHHSLQRKVIHLDSMPKSSYHY